MGIEKAGNSNVHAARVKGRKDQTPPRQPKIRQSIAFAREPALLIARDGVFLKHHAQEPSTFATSSFYLEVSGFEPGTQLTLVNLSSKFINDPDGSDKATMYLSGYQTSDIKPSGVEFKADDEGNLAGFYINDAKATLLDTRSEAWRPL